MKPAQIFTTFAFLLTFAVCVSAQSVQFPNELKGYEFFGKGKLKDLQLTVSSRGDVKNIFGANCEKQCDYDAEWTVRFEYYEDTWIKENRNEMGEKIRYRLDSKYLGKLRSTELRPKKEVSFANISFSNQFQRLLLTSTSTFRSDHNISTGDEAFQDSNGLTYEIITEPLKYGIKNKKTKSYNKGDLVLIRYSISEVIEKDLFILQN